MNNKTFISNIAFPSHSPMTWSSVRCSSPWREVVAVNDDWPPRVPREAARLCGHWWVRPRLQPQLFPARRSAWRLREAGSWNTIEQTWEMVKRVFQMFQAVFNYFWWNFWERDPRWKCQTAGEWESIWIVLWYFLVSVKKPTLTKYNQKTFAI